MAKTIDPTRKIRWGILGSGMIARTFSDAMRRSRTGVLAAVGTRDPAKPGLPEHFPGARIHGGYDELLADPEVDAVYLALPNPMHVTWALRAAEAGKHLLCEKPLGVNQYEALAIMDAARRSKTFLMEAYMYRCHPQTRQVVELVEKRAIGELRMIQASFGFASSQPKTHRHFASELAGGAILDVGGYTMSFARLLAGAAAGEPFLDPVSVSGAAQLGSTGVDEWSAATLRFSNGIVAQLSASVALGLESTVRLFGTEGRIEVQSPWFAGGRSGGVSKILVHAKDGSVRTIEVEEPDPLYTFEIDVVGDALHGGQVEARAPAMSWADSLGNLRAMDAWRSSIGLEYPLETPAERTHPYHGGKLTVSAAPMRRANLYGAAKQPSAIALGVAWIKNISHAGVILDPFFERGGNFFDTAFGYAGGEADKILGNWLRTRGVRDQSYILGKGAHTPLCYPDVVARQIGVSLDRLHTDHFDCWLLHRDNLDVPVGEFVDALNAELKAGRIRSYGMSNWTRERMDEAIAYAKASGLQAPSVLSNNFSLAEMIKPLWPGCVSSSNDAWRGWLEQNEVGLVAWSSQARGFFTDRAGRHIQDDPEMVRTWYSAANFGRRDRAVKLASERGYSANQVALAYCLHQKVPVVPIIGPLLPTELEDSLGALDIDLSQEDVTWLRDGDTE